MEAHPDRRLGGRDCRLASRRRAEHGDECPVTGRRAHGLLRTRRGDGWEDVDAHLAGTVRGSVCQNGKVLKTPGRGAILGVDVVNAGRAGTDLNHIASVEIVGDVVRDAVDVQRGAGLARAVHRRGSAQSTDGLDAAVLVHEPLEAERDAHRTHFVLFFDLGRRLEQALQRVNDVRFIDRVDDGRTATILRGGVVRENRARRQVNQGRIGRRTDRADRVGDVDVLLEAVVVDLVGDGGDGGLKQPFAEIVNRQKAVRRGERERHLRLSCQGQRNRSFRDVLNRKAGAFRGDELGRFANVQDRPDLRSVYPVVGINIVVQKRSLIASRPRRTA